MDIETVAMTIIAHSGDARSKAFNALSLARKGKYTEAFELMEASKVESVKAHQAQTEVLFKEARGESIPINVLLIHSQDHLMTSMLALELIEEMLYLHKNKEEKIQEEKL